jgi:hypothetical protein
MDNQILVSDYAAMDRVFKEERQYILNLCKAIKKSGATVVLVQKSILRCGMRWDGQPWGAGWCWQANSQL